MVPDRFDCDYDNHMKTVGSRELKARLGSYLRQVRSGTSIVVTDRGRPVAELRPLGSDAALDHRLADLAERGVVTLPTKPLPAPPRRVRLRGPGLSETIVADREDRF